MTRSSAGLVAFLFCTLATWTASVQATPQFARETRLRCTACHLLPPTLNAAGLDFRANGYRLPPSLERQQTAAGQGGSRTIPLAAWITGRFEDRGSGGPRDVLLPKVELISGGSLGERWSYFVEWRIVSLSLNGDGSLQDRGGRFEDLFFEWEGGGERSHAFKLGQYRALNQLDVSLRLSNSEPELFRNGLPTGEQSDPRLASLDRFSPSSRSPSLGYSFRSLAGSRPSDGLFHHITVPFIGELSIPLSAEASNTASFELEGPPKGVFLETYYRSGLKSIGAHAFVADEGWLLTALGTLDWKNLVLTAGVGVDERDGESSRLRSSVQVEYFFRRQRGFRAAPGLRIEDVTEDNRRAAWVPYLAMTLPNTQHTFLFQLQYKSEEDRDSFVLDLSALF